MACIRSASLAVLFLFLVTVAGIARADVIRYTAILSGLSEIPPVATTGSGTAEVFYNDVAHTLQVNAIWADLLGTTTVAHIHAPATSTQIATAVPFNGTWGVATQPGTFTGFPVGTTDGSYSGAAYSLLDDAAYTSGFLAANGGTAALAEEALISYFNSGKAYLNIHSTFAPGGEIKGYLVAQIPEPSTYGLVLAGLALIAFIGRRRKSS